MAEGGGWGEEFRHARAFRLAKRGGQVRFRFLDLCIRFGKMISKVCEGFNSGANRYEQKRALIFLLLIVFGIFMVVYGGYDDSPGAQLLGVLLTLADIFFALKSRKKL